MCIGESKKGALGCARFTEIASELTKTASSGATEFGVWIGNCNVKVWKSTEDKLHKIWNSKYFSQISAKWAHPRHPIPQLWSNIFLIVYSFWEIKKNQVGIPFYKNIGSVPSVLPYCVIGLLASTISLDFRVTALEENGGSGGNSSVAELEVRVETLEAMAADHETRISSTESDVTGN